MQIARKVEKSDDGRTGTSAAPDLEYSSREPKRSSLARDGLDLNLRRCLFKSKVFSKMAFA